MLLIFIGPPGAGKGTQSRRLCEKYNILHLSTGVILRNAKAEGSELGKIVGPIMDSGGLVGDDLMIKVVRERTEKSDCQNGFLLDGYPRTIPQANDLEKMLHSRNQRLDAVIEMLVPRQELERRLAGRSEDICDPRPEDHPETISTRLSLYESLTKPLLKYYRDKNLLITVDGTGTPDEVFSRIVSALNEKAAVAN